MEDKSSTASQPAYLTRAAASQRGQALVGTLIVAAIVAIFAGVTASIIRVQAQQTKAMSEKLAVSDLSNLLNSALASGSVCKYVLNGATFDSTSVSAASPQTIPVQALYASILPSGLPGPVVAQSGLAPSPYSPSAVVSSITMSINGAPSTPPPPGPNASFTGQWVIAFDQAKTAIALQPIVVAVVLTVDTSTPKAAKITSCDGDVAGACPSGLVLAGVNADGSLLCKDPTKTLAATCSLSDGRVGIAGFEPVTLNSCCIVPDYSDFASNGAYGADCSPIF
jgi:hypothetical protein